MKKSNLLNTLILAALAAPGMAMAEEASPVSANIGLVSDYLFRGISQTGANPALQGGFDYAHESGFYAGVWGSNVSFPGDAGEPLSASLELDTYAGFGGAFAEDFSYDVGYLRYNYPGEYAVGTPTKLDTDEIYGAIGWKWVTLKYSRALGDTFGVDKAKGSNYVELNVSYSLADSGVELGAHYGKQSYEGADADALELAGTSASYSDYNLSAEKDFSGYVVGLTYSATNVKEGTAGDYYRITRPDGTYANLGKSAVVLSVSHSM